MSVADTVALIRDVEESIAAEYPLQRMRCPVHLSLGAEEPAATVCAHLTRQDLVLAHHRCHAPYIAKGGDVQRMLDELHGLPTGCTEGRGGSMHLSDPEAGFVAAIPVVGAVLPIAAGVALSLKGTGHIAVAFVGDGATETGVFYETLNLGAVLGLPLLIVIEDNGWSVDTPSQQRQGWPVEFMRNPWRVDASEAVGRARSSITTLLRHSVTRRVEHCGPRILA